MQKVSILASIHKAGIEEALGQIVHLLESWNIQVLLPKDVAELLNRNDIATTEKLTEADLFIALGGDGCVLSAAHTAAPHGIPVLGIRLGGFGFLTAAELDESQKALEKVKTGDFFLEKRTMVQVNLKRDEKVICSEIGLNDIVMVRSPSSPLPQWDIWVNDEQLANYPADGVAISTPTGSTAYSLSAGGPILSPNVPALLVMPMCAHTLTLRPLVVNQNETIKVRLLSQRRPVSGIATLDGQIIHQIYPEDWVEISLSPHQVKIVCFHDFSFFKRLRQKLCWGERQ